MPFCIVNFPLEGPIIGAAVLFLGAALNFFTFRNARINIRERTYKLIFEESPIAMWIMDNSSQRILSANDAFLKLYGYSKEEIPSLCATDLRENHEALNLAQVALAMSQNPDKKNLSRHVKKDGSKIFIEVKACTINFMGKKCSLVMNNDVTERIVTDKILRESEANLKALINNTADCVGSVDLAGKVITANRQFQFVNKLLYGNNVIIGIDIFESFSEEAKNFIHPYFEQCLTGKKVEFERTIQIDGKDVCYEYALSPIINENAEINGVTFFARDISARKRDAEIIRKNAAKFKAVVENTRDAIWSVNAQGKITVCNSNYKALYKDTFNVELEPMMDVFAGLPPDVREQSYDKFNRVMQGEHINFETTYPIKGKIMHMEASITPIFMEDGSITGATYYCRDITERRETEARMRTEEDRYSRLISTMNDGLIYTDTEDLIQFANERFYQLVGFSEKDILQNRCVDFLLDEENREIVRQKNLLRKEGISDQYELRMKNKSGDTIFVITKGSPIYDDSGSYMGSLATFTDITERKHSENRVKEINQELDQFAYVVSHDLKAPLRAISNLSAWIEEDMQAFISDDAKQNLNLLRGRVLRMETLINGILEYSRAGRITRDNENVALKPLVDEVVDTLVPPANVKINVNPGLPIVYAQKIKIYQVFANLIGNAIKYHDKEFGNIEISYTDLGDSYEFVVSDNGPGIEDKYHDRIFVIFQTLHSRDKIESTGVGLAIVKKIVIDAGGSIRVQSSPGMGSSFIFTWPKKEIKENAEALLIAAA